VNARGYIHQACIQLRLVVPADPALFASTSFTNTRLIVTDLEQHDLYPGAAFVVTVRESPAWNLSTSGPTSARICPHGTIRV
jgi:hypothetical protein